MLQNFAGASGAGNSRGLALPGSKDEGVLPFFGVLWGGLVQSAAQMVRSEAQGYAGE